MGASSVRKRKIWTPRTLAWIKQIPTTNQMYCVTDISKAKPSVIDTFPEFQLALNYMKFVESMDKLRFSLENLMNRPHKQSPVLLQNTIDRLAQTSATMSFYYAQWAHARYIISFYFTPHNCLFTAITEKDGNKMKRILKFDLNSDEQSKMYEFTRVTTWPYTEDIFSFSKKHYPAALDILDEFKIRRKSNSIVKRLYKQSLNNFKGLDDTKIYNKSHVREVPIDETIRYKCGCGVTTDCCSIRIDIAPLDTVNEKIEDDLLTSISEFSYELMIRGIIARKRQDCTYELAVKGDLSLSATDGVGGQVGGEAKVIVKPGDFILHFLRIGDIIYCPDCFAKKFPFNMKNVNKKCKTLSLEIS